MQITLNIFRFPLFRATSFFLAFILFVMPALAHADPDVAPIRQYIKFENIEKAGVRKQIIETKPDQSIRERIDFSVYKEDCFNDLIQSHQLQDIVDFKGGYLVASQDMIREYALKCEDGTILRVQPIALPLNLEDISQDTKQQSNLLGLLKGFFTKEALASPATVIIIALLIGAAVAGGVAVGAAVSNNKKNATAPTRLANYLNDIPCSESTLSNNDMPGINDTHFEGDLDDTDDPCGKFE